LTSPTERLAILNRLSLEANKQIAVNSESQVIKVLLAS